MFENFCEAVYEPCSDDKAALGKPAISMSVTSEGIAYQESPQKCGCDQQQNRPIRRILTHWDQSKMGHFENIICKIVAILNGYYFADDIS